MTKLDHTFEAESESEFLKAYQKQQYAKPSVTVDMVVFTVVDSVLRVLTIQRKGHPYKGFLALPGGFLNVKDDPSDQGEDLEEAAHRELEEETSLPRGSCFLEQLYTFGKAGRDPRTRVISVAYFALVPPHLAYQAIAGDDAASLAWLTLDEIQQKGMAFDHAEILAKAVARLRGKIDYTNIAFNLVPPTFTVPELRRVYEAVKGVTFNPQNFHRRVRRMVEDGILLQAVGERVTSSRPAKVYRFNKV